MKKVLALICLSLALTGCSTINRINQQQNTAQINTQKQQLIDQADQCYASLPSDPAIKPISGKVAFQVKDQTLPMYSNNSKPTAKEKVAIQHWYEKAQTCRKYVDAAIQLENIPEFSQVTAANWGANQQLFIDLYSGKITYGQFATGRKNVQVETDKAMDLAVGAANQRAADAKAKEDAARQKRMSAIGDALIQAGTPPATSNVGSSNNLPTSTTCTQQGVILNCTTN